MTAARAVPFEASPTDSLTIEKLRERIRKMEAAPRLSRLTVSTGFGPLDALLNGGFPAGAVIELVGSPGCGKTSLALKALAAPTRAGQLCAYVEASPCLYAPAVAALGVRLEALLVVRPKLSSQALWAALQLLRSGSFLITVLDLTQAPALSLTEIKKLTDAASKSQRLLILLTAPTARAMGGMQFELHSVEIDNVQVDCVRSRRGQPATVTLNPLTLTQFNQVLRPRKPGLWCQPKRFTVTSATQFARPQSGLQRNGHQGVYGQRPGRDVTMPALFGAASLGG